MESQQQATAVAESSLTPITGSSNIKAYSYEADEQRLVIQFTNDAAYAYPQVPAETFQSFLASESKGRFFAAHLKGWTGAHRIQLVLHHASTLPAAPGAAPSLPEDQPTGKTYKDVDELFSAMGIPPSSGGSDEQIARRLVAWEDSGNTQGEHHETLREIINSARAALQAPSPEAGESEPKLSVQGLAAQLQQQCVDWGAYWRASDAHGVNLSVEQAVELLRDALGVEVEIAALPAQPQPSADRQEGNQQ